MRTATLAFSFRPLQLVRAAGLALALLVLTSTASHAQTWMVSTDAYIRLGVMDKFGQLGTYTARFVVSNQNNGKSYILVKEVEKGQNGIDVIFPSPASSPNRVRRPPVRRAATSGNARWAARRLSAAALPSPRSATT
jgi:hypothetical protein